MDKNILSFDHGVSYSVKILPANPGVSDPTRHLHSIKVKDIITNKAVGMLLTEEWRALLDPNKEWTPIINLIIEQADWHERNL